MSDQKVDASTCDQDIGHEYDWNWVYCPSLKSKLFHHWYNQPYEVVQVHTVVAHILHADIVNQVHVHQHTIISSEHVRFVSVQSNVQYIISHELVQSNILFFIVLGSINDKLDNKLFLTIELANTIISDHEVFTNFVISSFWLAESVHVYIVFNFWVKATWLSWSEREAVVQVYATIPPTGLYENQPQSTLKVDHL